MPEISLMHVHGESATQIGYGRLGVKLAAALEAAGVDVFNGIDAPAGSPGESEHVRENDRRGRTNVACWVSTPSHARGWLDGQYSGMFTMFETTRLPEGFRENLHNFDVVIVPSKQNVELFSSYHPNVKQVPLAVDTAEWVFTERPPIDREFRFLCGGSGPRKGTDLAVRAFKTVFKTWPEDGPVPKLVLKNPRSEDFYGDRIEMVGGKLSDADERAVYASCHVYVQPSRGEGWGLQPLQAMAQGMPTILTDAHGQAEFAHLGYGLGSTLTKSGYFIYGDAGDWWEPDFDELCESMRYCYDNWDQAQAKGKQAAVEVANRFTWEATAEAFIDAIGPDRLATPYAGSGAWVDVEQKVYPVRVLRPWKADLAGELHVFEPGRDYMETADVQRILFEADILDPACLSGPSEDWGLLPEQAAKIGAYSAKHSFCGGCGQKLNSGVTRADELMAEWDLADADKSA